MLETDEAAQDEDDVRDDKTARVDDAASNDEAVGTSAVMLVRTKERTGTSS